MEKVTIVKLEEVEMAFQCLSWSKYYMNIEDSNVIRMILLVPQLLCWEQCPLHLNFV